MNKSYYSIFGTAVAIALMVSLVYAAVKQFDIAYTDELYWIQSGEWSFQRFFVDHDFSSDTWKVEYETLYRTFGPYTPNVGKFFIGGFLHVNRIPPSSKMCYWDSNAIAIECLGERLKLSRTLSHILAGLTVALLFVITMTLLPMPWNWISAVLSCLVLTSHQAMRSAGRYVMLDIYVLFFSLLALSILFYKLRFGYRSLTSTIFWGSLAGISAGMAVASKLNGALVVMSIMMISLVDYWIKQDKYALFFVGIVIFWSPLVFLIVNPQLWSDPLGGSMLMVAHRDVIIDAVSAAGGTIISTIPEGLLWFYTRIFSEAFNVTRLSDRPIYQVDTILMLLCVGGVIVMVKKLNNTWPLVMHGAVITISTIVWIPTPELRYYLPVVPVVSFAIGMMGTAVLEKIVSLFLFLKSGQK